MKTFLFIIFCTVFCYTARSQSYLVTATPAVCPANGTIKITVTDPPAGTITYTLVNPENLETPAQSSNVFIDLAPGNYLARVYQGSLNIYEESVQILAQYVTSPPRITGFTAYTAYTCSGQPAVNNGGISFNVSPSEGSFPLQMYLYNGATYNGNNTLAAQTRIPADKSNTFFSNLAPGSYCALLTDTCSRSVIQNNIIVNAQNISYNIAVGNTSSVQAYLHTDANCQNYTLDPIQNMIISTFGFSISDLQYSIEWPSGVFTPYKTYFDRAILSLPLDYTTWDNTVKIYFKNPCNSAEIIGPYAMRLYTPGNTYTYPDYLSTDVLIRDLPDRNMCDDSGKAYILPYISQSNNTRMCFPVTVTVTSPDDPDFGGPKTYTWTSFTQNNYPSVSTNNPGATGIIVTAGYNYQCIFTDSKAVYPQTATANRYINPAQYGVKPKITVTPTEDPGHIGKGRFYISTSELLSEPYPVTIQSISGPAGYTPFSRTFNQKPTGNFVILSTNQPTGEYQMRISIGSCRNDTVLITLNNYIPLPDNISLDSNPLATCNSLSLQVVSSFAGAPKPIPFISNLLYVSFSQVPAGSSINKGSYSQLNYNSITNSFASNANSMLNQPSGTYVFQLYYQDFLDGGVYVPLLSSPIARTIDNPVTVIDVPNSGGSICQGSTTGTLIVNVSGGSANQKKYAIKPLGSSTYSAEQTSNQFTDLSAGYYMVRVNDGCNLIEQELEMVNVANGNIISGPDALCINEAGLLGIIPVGPVNSVTWTLPDLSTQTGASIPVFQSSPGSYTYKVNVSTKSGCNLSNQKSVYVSPASSTWVGTISKAWDDPANWNNQLVPGKCTFVTIPAGTSNYPDLTADMKAICDTILFKFGGEVAKTNYLSYNGAKVELTLNGQRWYMLSSPLYYMYSGDFWTAPFNIQQGDPEYSRVSPKIFMRQYQPATTTVAGMQADANIWSVSYNDMNIELPGGKGYSTWVSVALTDNRTLQFPRPETKYQYFASNGITPANVWTPELTRKNGIRNANKLIYDKDASSTLNIYNDDASLSTILVGNPFMSHLKVSTLVANNPDLSNTYYIWTGSAFDVFMAGGSISTLDLEDDDVLIAPMQSFIVEKSSNVKINSLNITPDMSVVSPGNTLRSASVDKNNIFQIEVLRDNQKESAVTFVFDEKAKNEYNSSKDARTLFSNTLTKPAVIYSPVSGYATSIRTIGNLSEAIPLNIRTSNSGQLELRLNQLDSQFRIRLEDRDLMDSKDLNTADYTFTSNGTDINGRFFLRFVQETTGMNETKTNNISLRSHNRSVSVNSSPDDIIQRIQAVDVSGKTIIGNMEINNSSYHFEVPENVNMLIIKVQTMHSQVVQKLAITP